MLKNTGLALPLALFASTALADATHSTADLAIGLSNGTDVTSLVTSSQAIVVAKQAILNAGPDAVGLLNGASPTDIFEDGKAAAETLLQAKFGNDTDAALAILELGERIRNGN